MAIFAPSGARPNAPVHMLLRHFENPIQCNPRASIDTVVCSDSTINVTCKNCLRILAANAQCHMVWIVADADAHANGSSSSSNT